MKLFQYCSLIIFFIPASSYAQSASQSQLYDVCGNPKLECKTSGGFDDADLPIKVTGKLEWMGEYKSKAFYAVIVQSRKVIAVSGPEEECGGQFTPAERSRLQSSFPSNRVFSSAFGCYYFEHSYTNVNTGFNFLAVYGGETEAAARTVLKAIKSTGKYPGANLRRMQAVLCNACH